MDQDQALFLQQNAADTLLRNTSSLQVLLSMGFPKDRALKALAATGDAGVQVACDWIFAHVKDPTLDQIQPREFILYACPAGTLGALLEEFWQQSLISCGRNGVHTSFPHVTLCSFLRCKDENVTKLVRAMKTACSQALQAAACPSKFNLEYFSTQNYVGLFLDENSANFLRKLSDCFAEEAQTLADTKVDSHSNKQLHVTLAYKFPANKFDKLESLAKKIDLKSSSTWEVRLYSRDPKYGNCETHRVLYPYSPESETKLQLINGDCIFVGSEDGTSLTKSGSEGWFYGTSWMTGCSGFFPASHTEKSTDTDTWTMHKSFTLSGSDPKGHRSKLSRKYSRGADEFHTSGYSSAQTLLQKDLISSTLHEVTPAQGGETILPPAPPRPPRDDIYASVQKPKGQVSMLKKIESSSRRIYIFRHCERVDVTFGKQWIQLSYDNEGNYHRKNLNMPKKLPKRPGGPKDFNHDSPITEMGMFQAVLTGQALKQVGVSFSHVFSSPSLRCLQTANSILKGMEQDKDQPIGIELGLYEWMKWSGGGFPKFLSEDELEIFGINIDKTYKGKFKESDMPLNEKCTEYFKRGHKFLTSIIKETHGDIMVVGHAGSLDSISRQIQGLSTRAMPEFVSIVTKVPYCGLVVIEEFPELGIWQLVDPPIPPLTHAPNPQFDWKMLQG